MPGWQRCHMLLKVPVHGLEENITRQMNSPVMVKAVLVLCTPRLQPLTFKDALPGLNRGLRTIFSDT